LKKREKFSLLESLDIISQVLSGYLSLSQKGFIHRDLKPANILIKNGVYMIGDFGFAALAGTIKSNS
jgi:calcium-dependent protein kinase